jgi:hypothetical protein
MPAKKIACCFGRSTWTTLNVCIVVGPDMKVINKDRVSITIKVAVKQSHYIPITPRLKRLFLCEETT